MEDRDAGLVRRRLLISGRVQGVFYRASAREAAAGLRLRGYVRNLPDGRVEAVAEGPAAAVERFIAWCRRGPPGARVTDVSVEDEPPVGEQGAFAVRR